MRPEQIVEIPVLFRAGRAVWPNMVNGLVIGSRFIAPRPFGPIVNGVEVLEDAVHSAFAPHGVYVRFVDDFDAYSRFAGEVHCGTNAVRIPSEHVPAQAAP